MSVKQINVFLENEPGRLAEVTSALSKANIDIRAVYVTDSTSYGILRFWSISLTRPRMYFKPSDLQSAYLMLSP